MHPIDRVLGKAVAQVEFAPCRAVGMIDALGGGQPDAALRIAHSVINPQGLHAHFVGWPGDELFSVKTPCANRGGGEQRAVRQRQQSIHLCGQPVRVRELCPRPCAASRGGRFVTPDGILAGLDAEPHHAVATRLREANRADRLAGFFGLSEDEDPIVAAHPKFTRRRARQRRGRSRSQHQFIKSDALTPRCARIEPRHGIQPIRKQERTIAIDIQGGRIGARQAVVAGQLHHFLAVKSR